MIIRHAEKPGLYPVVTGLQYNGINPFGEPDAESLVTMGWERAGALVGLFYPSNNIFQNAELAAPDYIYAASPAFKMVAQANGNIEQKEPSQRPYQTISALYARMQMPATNLNISFEDTDFASMVSSVLALPISSGTVLIAWQHQDILLKPVSTKNPNPDSIVNELLKQTNTPLTSLNIPANPWPQDRYDMVFVFDRPSGTGPFTAFTQVPQMLLAGDIPTPIS